MRMELPIQNIFYQLKENKLYKMNKLMNKLILKIKAAPKIKILKNNNLNKFKKVKNYIITS